MASAGTPYRLVPAHFYPCIYILHFLLPIVTMCIQKKQVGCPAPSIYEHIFKQAYIVLSASKFQCQLALNTLRWKGNEWRSNGGDALGLSWLIPFVTKRVGGRYLSVLEISNFAVNNENE